MANIERIQAPCERQLKSDCSPCPVMKDVKSQIIRSPQPQTTMIELSRKYCPGDVVMELPLTVTTPKSKW